VTSHSPDFDHLVGNSEITVLATKDHAFAHEAPVYLTKHDWIAFSTNRFTCKKANMRGATGCVKAQPVGSPWQFTMMEYLDFKTGEVHVLPERVWLDELAMANGGYPAGDGESAFVSSQGMENQSAGIYKVNFRTAEVEAIITTTNLMNAPFNSPNDVVVDPVSGALIFTDPIYGFVQGFRPRPQVGNWLWMYPMKNGSKEQRPHDLKVVADGFSRPNGVAFASAKGDVLYVTDTGYAPGADWMSNLDFQHAVANDSYVLDSEHMHELANDVHPLQPRTVFAFDVQRDDDGNIVSLFNRRIVAIATEGIPDGIKVDCDGRIYAGQSNGVGIYSKDGKFLGSVNVPEGAANLVLIPRTDEQGNTKTQLVMMGETSIFSILLNSKTCVISR